MKAYLATSGTIFGMIVLAHVARAIVEGSRVSADPIFIALTLMAIALSVWAWLLLLRMPRR